MKADSKKFLQNLLNAYSPSGFEEEIQEVVKKRVKPFADEISKDVHGNLTAVCNPKGKIRIMLAGHCDQIGFMVKYVDDSGYVRFSPIGGFDPAVLPGQSVWIHTKKGKIAGVIGHPPAHLVPRDQRGKKGDLKSMWIDVGATADKKSTKKIAVGDSITFCSNYRELENDCIASPGCDDRAGVFVVMEALRIFSQAISRKKSAHPVALHAVSTVGEEVGLRGARTACYQIDPQVGIAVDVTHATDNPGAKAQDVGRVDLGKGPTIAHGANFNRPLLGLMQKVAKEKKIPYQDLASAIPPGTDANVMQISRSGVAVSLVGVPNRYMHTSVEIINLNDLEEAANLLAQTALKITEKTSFIP